ncbi:GAP family protein [Microlunatus soli]|uniref:Threonine/homoserine/homoserine lactone efflux protein n=1 Tax=Microlunatus soli TaxID=630515 RepID=A0A1H1YY04_9ACTN|nr:GAP family protein [Microlunatus soli]SDT26219.1 Threonine/homoserine/homoserine lactone efflux protein [Microlunatus soli]
MGQVIGDILPIALAIAISPMPIMAVVLMLMSAHGRGASLAFLLAWILGVAMVVTIATIAISPASGDDDGPSRVASLIKVLLGVATLVLAFRQWRKRPEAGQEPARPRWMATIDSMTVGKAFVTGAVLSTVNPKNLALGLTGGVTIGAVDLGAGGAVIAIVVFVAIASCTVAAPVFAYLTAPDRVRAPLDGLRVWLEHHNAAVMAVLLLLMGVSIIGKGVAGL